MTVLHLTKPERIIWDALPNGLKEGWEIEQEANTTHDTPAHFQMRLALLRLHDPKLMQLRDAAMKSDSAETVTKLLEETNLSNVSDGDLAELFFALGPSMLSEYVSSLLKKAKDDPDLEDIAALTTIRHELLLAASPQ
jgi:hypothetical protein